MSKYRDAMEATMRKVLPLPLPAPAVDLGGRGHRDWMASIIGPDFETWDIQEGGGTTRVVDAMRMKGIPDASLGTVLSTSAFEHVAKPWSAAAQVARVTRPGGLLFICVPFIFDYHACPEDYWRLTPAALRVLFAENYDELACDWVSKKSCYYLGRRKPAGGEDEAVQVALAIPGLVIEEELRFLYRMAMSAPEGGEFVELGTYRGRSCALLCYAAAVRGQIPWTVDDYSYKTPCSPQEATKRLHALGLAAYVVRGDSRAVPDGLGRVSFLFIDSHHVPEQIAAEMAAWTPRLLPGAVMACHDYEHTKWREMKAAIDGLFAKGWQRLGQAGSMVAFRRIT